MKKLKKQLLEMQLKYNGLEKKCTNEARELQHNIEMTVKAINVIHCCKSDSELLRFLIDKFQTPKGNYLIELLMAEKERKNKKP